jgi:cytochrome c oxidase cbb3-type subunit 1
VTTQAEATPTTWRAAVGVYLAISAVFAVGAGLLATWNALQLVWPDVGAGAAPLTFGRVRPMALNAIVYGWLGFGLLGAAFHIVPRLSGAALWRPRLGSAGAVLAAVSLAGGIGAVGAGYSQGGFLFELPVIADVGLAIGLGTAAFVLIRSAATAAESDQPALWFALAGAVWLPLGFVAGAVPGFRGLNAAIQNAFGVTATVTLAVLSLAIGAAYFVAGESRRDHRGTRVAHLGFWSFAFIAAWTAPRLLVFGPAADWLETIGVTFSLVLVIPALALMVDLAGRLRGLAQRRLLIAGGGFFIAFVVLNMVSSFRSPSSITRFTSWEDALLFIPLLGAAGSWLLAFASHLGGRVGWRWQGIALVEGTFLAALAMLAGGLQQGIAWVGGVNSGEPVTAGPGFVGGATAWYVIAAMGTAIAAAAMAGYGAMVLRRSSDDVVLEHTTAAGDAEDAPEPAPPIGIPVLMRGAIGLFALAAVSVFGIPTLDAPNTTATLVADAREFAPGTLAALGADLYVTEGCVYCHTQQVRPIIADVGLGAVSVPGDYARQSPMALGYRRVGPDLTNVGQRTTSTRLLLELLRAPRDSFDGGDGTEWSVMPSYDYLPDNDLLAIAEYLGALD